MEGHRCEGKGHTGPVRGRDVRLTMELSFAEALSGVRRKIAYRIPSTGEREVCDIASPAGAVDGGRLRYRGHGDLGTGGGERGDLIVVTRVLPDPLFRLDGADIRMSWDVDAETAR